MFCRIKVYQYIKSSLIFSYLKFRKIKLSPRCTDLVDQGAQVLYLGMFGRPSYQKLDPVVWGLTKDYGVFIRLAVGRSGYMGPWSGFDMGRTDTGVWDLSCLMWLLYPVDAAGILLPNPLQNIQNQWGLVPSIIVFQFPILL